MRSASCCCKVGLIFNGTNHALGSRMRMCVRKRNLMQTPPDWDTFLLRCRQSGKDETVLLDPQRDLHPPQIAGRLFEVREVEDLALESLLKEQDGTQELAVDIQSQEHLRGCKPLLNRFLGTT